MPRIPMHSAFTVIPEGTYIFRVYAVDYDEEFGKIKVKLVTAKGQTHTETFTIKDRDDIPNEKAMNAFCYFAKTVMNDFTLDDIDPVELIDHYITGEVKHTHVQSRTDPDKILTFANLGQKSPADGFTETPTAKAMTLGKEPKTVTPPPAETPTAKGLDLDALLG